MKAELKKQWVDALRSGQYVQGREHLGQKTGVENNFNYCCLGVLCETLKVPKKIEVADWISTEANWDTGLEETTRNYFETNYYKFGTNMDDSTCLPDEFLAVLDLPNTTATTLMAMNDGDGMKAWSFEEIATWIEENV